VAIRSPGEQSVSQNAADLGSPSRRCTVGQISRSWLAPWHLRGTRVGDFSRIYGRRKLLRLFSNYRLGFRVCVLGEYGPLLGPVTPALDDPVERCTVTRDNDIRRAQTVRELLSKFVNALFAKAFVRRRPRKLLSIRPRCCQNCCQSGGTARLLVTRFLGLYDAVAARD